MKNLASDVLGDILGHSKGNVEPHVPNLGHHSQKKFPTASLIPEESVMILSSLRDLEPSSKQSKRELFDGGYVPKVPEITTGRLAQILDTALKGAAVEPIDYKTVELAKGGIAKGFSTGSRTMILASFRQLEKSLFDRKIKSDVVEKIIRTPKRVVAAIESELSEVERSLLHNIRKGHIRKYTIPTAVAIATESNKFAVGAFIDAAHSTKNTDLISALAPVYRAKVESLPQAEKVRLNLVKA